MKKTIYRRYSRDTIRIVGQEATYHVEKPYTSDSEMIWADPVEVTIPDGFTVADNTAGIAMLYDQTGAYYPITDRHEKPYYYDGQNYYAL